MEKEFVPYEQALALKELGFDEQCFAYYSPKGMFIDMKISKQIGFDISAPLYQQAFKWFREKYHLYGKVETTSLTCHFIMIKEVTLDRTIRERPRYVTYNSYEEAELDCLKKLIEIVEKELIN